MPRYCFFFLQSSRYVSNEQPCLKTTGLYEDLLLLSSLFHFFYFIFSLPFHLVYVFQFLHLFCFDVLSQAFQGFSDSSVGKESTCNVGDLGSILGWKDRLEKGMATHSGILAQRIPWREKPGRLQSMGSQRVRHD